MPAWPYVGIVICLFLMVVLAAQSWKSLTPERANSALAVSTEQITPLGPDLHAEEGMRFGATLRAPPTVAKPRARDTAPLLANQVAMARIAIEQTQSNSYREESATARTAPSSGTDDVVSLAARVVASPIAEDVTTASVVPSKTADDVTPETVSGGPSSETDDVVAATTVPASPWPQSLALMAQLTSLSDVPAGRLWADRVRRELRLLQTTDSLASSQSAKTLDNLSLQAAEIDSILRTVETHAVQSELIRVQYALERRLVVWQAVHKLSANPSHGRLTEGIDYGPMVQHIRAVESMLEGHQHEEAWRRALMLSKLEQITNPDGHEDLPPHGQLARHVLTQLQPTRLNQDQQEFLKRRPISNLIMELRHWASEPISYEQLLSLLEDFQLSSSYENSRRLAELCSRLRDSPNAEHARLGAQLDMHYRNSNLRLMLTEEFINRLVPPVQSVTEPVHDEILGARVSGRSETQTQLFVRLLPDASRVRLRLEAQGVVTSDTVSDRWPVTIFSEAHSSYLTGKEFLLDKNSLRTRRAEGHAQSRTRMKRMQSEFDSIPLVGALVRNIARSQHQQQRQQMYWEIENRVADRARRRMDSEAERRAAQARQRLQTKLVDPLRRLQVNPVTLDMQTTEKHLVARWRLAGHHQMAAFTPRPRALDDSMANVQIHQSAVNNVIEQLNLAGQRRDLRDFYEYLARQLGFDAVHVPDELPQGVTIQLADEEPLKIQLHQGRMTITIKVAQLTRGSRVWRDFIVRSHYHPVRNGLAAELVRDHSIELIGRGLGLRKQIALRGVFTKVFDRNRPFPMIHPQLANDARLSDLEIRQFTVHEGWIGLDIGTKVNSNQRVSDKSPIKGRN